MIKHFCDCCGNEYNPGKLVENPKLKYTLKGVKREGDVTIHMPGEHDVCLYCLIDAINTLDDRHINGSGTG